VGEGDLRYEIRNGEISVDNVGRGAITWPTRSPASRPPLRACCSSASRRLPRTSRSKRARPHPDRRPITTCSMPRAIMMKTHNPASTRSAYRGCQPGYLATAIRPRVTLDRHPGRGGNQVEDREHGVGRSQVDQYTEGSPAIPRDVAPDCAEPKDHGQAKLVSGPTMAMRKSAPGVLASPRSCATPPKSQAQCSRPRCRCGRATKEWASS
jgi:hypothetical protein